MSILMVLSTFMTEGKSYYNSASNNFGGLFPNPGMRMAGRYKAIEENVLIEENATMATSLTIDTILINSTAYRYQIKFANLNNKQGKTRSIKNPMTGEKTTITSTEWGLVFNYDIEGNYCAVVLSCDNSAPFNDITDQRTMSLKVIQRFGTDTRELAQTTLTRGVSLEDDMNTLSMQVGYLVGPGARVAIERAVLTIENEKQVAAKTLWTREALDEYFTVSADPVEGYWKYLDRDMQDQWLRLGGRYTLAVVRSDDGYDIIYIDGAQVKKSLWHEGMLKGHMTKTVFSGNYDATWIDATMEPIEKDVQATIENGVILTMSFPVFKSQVRFAKVLSTDD